MYRHVRFKWVHKVLNRLIRSSARPRARAQWKGASFVYQGRALPVRRDVTIKFPLAGKGLNLRREAKLCAYVFMYTQDCKLSENRIQRVLDPRPITIRSHYYLKKYYNALSLNPRPIVICTICKLTMIYDN